MTTHFVGRSSYHSACCTGLHEPRSHRCARGPPGVSKTPSHQKAVLRVSSVLWGGWLFSSSRLLYSAPRKKKLCGGRSRFALITRLLDCCFHCLRLCSEMASHFSCSGVHGLLGMPRAGPCSFTNFSISGSYLAGRRKQQQYIHCG